MRPNNEREVVEKIGDLQVKLVRPLEIKHGRVLYGDVLSGDHFYPVAKVRYGKSYSYRCGCEGHIKGGVRICKHIAAFVVLERKTLNGRPN